LESVAWGNVATHVGNHFHELAHIHAALNKTHRSVGKHMAGATTVERINLIIVGTICMARTASCGGDTIR
jgi:hypothetical protein